MPRPSARPSAFPKPGRHLPTPRQDFMNDAKTIVIVGGGFAGTTLACALEGKLPPPYQLLLVSEESHTTFNPMLPETLGASIFPEQVVAPIRQMLSHGRFVMGRVNALAPGRQTGTTTTLAGALSGAHE